MMMSLTISFISSFVCLWLWNKSWRVAGQSAGGTLLPGVLWRGGRNCQACFFTYSCIPSSSGQQKNLTAWTVKLQPGSTTKLQNLNVFYMGLNVVFITKHGTCLLYNLRTVYNEEKWFPWVSPRSHIFNLKKKKVVTIARRVSWEFRNINLLTKNRTLAFPAMFSCCCSFLFF